MCKENKRIIALGIETVAENVKASSKGGYRIMRRGKTRRDHASGSHAARLENRSAKAEENRKFHHKKGG